MSQKIPKIFKKKKLRRTPVKRIDDSGRGIFFSCFVLMASPWICFHLLSQLIPLLLDVTTGGIVTANERGLCNE